MPEGKKKRPRHHHGEGTVFKRKDGRWQASISLGKDANGKRQRLTRYGRNRQDALDELHKAMSALRQGALVTGPQQLLRQYLDYWLEEVHKQTLRKGTYIGYRIILDNHLLPSLGHIPIQKLTPQHVQHLYAQKQKEGFSARTIRNIHAVLHKALADAVREEIVTRNVCDRVTRPRLTKQEIVPLTVEQAYGLLEIARGHRLEVLLTMAVATGMRRGELLALKWQDIDLERKCLYVQRTMTRYPKRYAKEVHVVNEPKTSQGRRKIILPDFAIEALKKQRVYQAEARTKAGEKWEEHDLVFSNSLGKFLEPSYVGARFAKLLEEAGLPHMRFHDLRHGAATILLHMGAHPKVVQELLGHSTISITLDIYSHALPSMQQEVMTKLNTMFQNDKRKAENNQNAIEDTEKE